MTDEQFAMVSALLRCTFQPGSYDKRFVRDVGSYSRQADLSPRQDWFLRRTYWRYRVQIGHKGQKPADFDNPPASLQAPVKVPDGAFVCRKPSSPANRAAHEAELLNAWNAGRPRKVS